MFKLTCKNKFCNVYNQPYELEDNPGTTECGICQEEMLVETIN